MKSFRTHLKQGKDVAAMIHLQALPGTPANHLKPAEIIDQAVREAAIYQEIGYRTVIIENMHDTPYTRQVGPETTAVMAVIADRIKRLGLYVGIQVLAACNREALAVAHAAAADFIRVEGFVFGHVADEGYIESCAGDLLRYRKQIDADSIMVFADIKKKHSSHAITADVDLAETARAAGFFGADGVIITGTSTGTVAAESDLKAISDIPLFKAIGSGLTEGNLSGYLPLADLFIVGSHLKEAGLWSNPPDLARSRKFYETFFASQASL